VAKTNGHKKIKLFLDRQRPKMLEREVCVTEKIRRRERQCKDRLNDAWVPQQQDYGDVK
jgi:hypothetical protein